MPSEVKKRSISVSGHQTSISLEDEFWSEIRTIASKRGLMLSDLISSIDLEKTQTNLSSALRLFVLRVTLSNLKACQDQLHDLKMRLEPTAEPIAEMAVRQ